jgi:hypothetical protein
MLGKLHQGYHIAVMKKNYDPTLEVNYEAKLIQVRS